MKHKTFTTLVALIGLTSIFSVKILGQTDTFKGLGWYTDYDVKFYKIDLNVNDTTTNISGNTSILSAVKAGNLSVFRFELSPSLTIDSIFITNKKTPFSRLGDITLVTLPTIYHSNELLAVTIYYRGKVTASDFFSSVSSKRDNGWNISATWSLSEPFGAKQWFPCKQQLSDKADSAYIFITVPKKCKAGSNGLLTNVISTDKYHSRYEWKTHYPIAYYLLSFSVAEYKDYSFYAKLDGKDSVLIQNYVYDRPKYLDENKLLIDKTDDLIRFYSSLLGPYPFKHEKYGHCLAPIDGGMEHQTMTTLMNFDFSLIAHEMAHQWFGDQITCSSWQDIWINEGFASYMEYLAIKKFDTPLRSANWLKWACQSALNEPNGSVFVPYEKLNSEDRIFDNNLTYKKGAYLLHMLRYEINNDSLFFKILRIFLIKYNSNSVSAHDFISLVNQLTSSDFSWFFDQWYYGKGFPKFDVSWKQDNDTLYIVSAQTTTSPTTSFFRTHFDLKLSSNQHDTIVKILQNREKMELKIPFIPKIDSIIFDPEQWLLKKVNCTQMPYLPINDDYLKINNPFTNELTIFFPKEQQTQLTIKVIDINGKVIQETKTSKKSSLKINTKIWEPGAYVLYVTSNNNKYIHKIFKTL